MDKSLKNTFVIPKAIKLTKNTDSKTIKNSMPILLVDDLSL